MVQCQPWAQHAKIGYAGLDALGDYEKAPLHQHGRTDLVAVSFALPKAPRPTTARGVLRVLRIAPGRSADLTLNAMIDAAAAAFPLPSACVVANWHARRRVLAEDHYTDLLSALVVLTKCSEHIWLRDKFPSLAVAFARRSVRLYLTPAQRDHLRRCQR